MDDKDDIRQPLDHLPPLEERDRAIEIEEPSYPDTGESASRSGVSPDTAAEPGDVSPHGLDNPRSGQR